MPIQVHPCIATSTREPQATTCRPSYCIFSPGVPGAAIKRILESKDPAIQAHHPDSSYTPGLAPPLSHTGSQADSLCETATTEAGGTLCVPPARLLLAHPPHRPRSRRRRPGVAPVHSTAPLIPGRAGPGESGHAAKPSASVSAASPLAPPQLRPPHPTRGRR